MTMILSVTVLPCAVKPNPTVAPVCRALWTLRAKPRIAPEL